jgi:hypothetical protein
MRFFTFTSSIFRQIVPVRSINIEINPQKNDDAHKTDLITFALLLRLLYFAFDSIFQEDVIL